MVNAIQSGPQWSPNIPREGFKQKINDEAFAKAQTPQNEKVTGFEFFGANGFTPSDAIDIVNPLQHLPIIGPLYREFTGDVLDPFSRIAGNTLFFGPFGAAFASINIAVEEMTGKDVGSNIISILKYDNTGTAELQADRTNLVTPPRTSPDKNHAINPVMAWAAAEIHHQNIEAVKRGRNLPTRPYSMLVASITSTNADTAPINFAYAPHETKSLASKPGEKALRQTETFEVLNQLGPVALNALIKAPPKAPTTLQQIKNTTNAYKSITTYIDQSSIERTIKSSASKVSDPKTDKALTPDTIPTNGGWFSSSLNSALSKYAQAKAPRFFKH